MIEVIEADDQRLAATDRETRNRPREAIKDAWYVASTRGTISLRSAREKLSTLTTWSGVPLLFGITTSSAWLAVGDQLVQRRVRPPFRDPGMGSCPAP